MRKWVGVNEMFGLFKKHKQENVDGAQTENEQTESAAGIADGAQADGALGGGAQENDNLGDGTAMNNGAEGETVGETAEGETVGTVEKIKLSDVNGLKAEMRFDEEIERLKNDKQFLMECYRYVKAHADELKALLGVDDIKLDE